MHHQHHHQTCRGRCKRVGSVECATRSYKSLPESSPAFRMSIKLSAKMMHSINFVGTMIIIVKRIAHRRLRRRARNCAPMRLSKFFQKVSRVSKKFQKPVLKWRDISLVNKIEDIMMPLWYLRE